MAGSSSITSVLIRWCFGIVAILLFLVLMLYIKFGSVAAGIAWVNGASAYLAPGTLRFDSSELEADAVTQIQIHNLSSRRMKIVGRSVSCGCLRLISIPDHIPAHDSRSVELCVEDSAALKRLGTAEIVLYTDSPSSGILRAQVFLDN